VVASRRSNLHDDGLWQNHFSPHDMILSRRFRPFVRHRLQLRHLDGMSAGRVGTEGGPARGRIFMRGLCIVDTFVKTEDARREPFTSLEGGNGLHSHLGCGCSRSSLKDLA
jgi:hypothetical protein